MIHFESLNLMIENRNINMNDKMVYINLRVNEDVQIVSEPGKLIYNLATWRGNVFPVINVPRNSERYYLQFQIITNYRQILGVAKTSIDLGHPRQDSIEVIDIKGRRAIGRLLYDVKWIYMRQSDLQRNNKSIQRHNNNRGNVVLQQKMEEESSGCICGSKRKIVRNRLSFVNKVIEIKESQLEQGKKKNEQVHNPVQYYSKSQN